MDIEISQIRMERRERKQANIFGKKIIAIKNSSTARLKEVNQRFSGGLVGVQQAGTGKGKSTM